MNEYTFTQYEILGYDLEEPIPVLEAASINSDIKSNTGDSMKSKSILTKLGDQINSILDHITGFIQRVMSRLNQAFKRALLTNKGFKKQLREAETKYKPLSGLQLYTYQYTDKSLFSDYELLTKIFTRVINEIANSFPKLIASQNDDSDSSKQPYFLLDTKGFQKYIFSEMKLPENIHDATVYFPYIRKKFRGNKVKRNVMNTEIPAHMKIVDGYDELRRFLNTKSAYFNQHTNSLRLSIKRYIAANDIPVSVKKKLTRTMSNVSQLYNIYSSLTSIYFEMRVEQMLHSRAILKKLYQI